MSESNLIPDESAQPQQAVAAPRTVKKRKSIFKDPVVRVLSVVAGGLVVLYLATVVAALLMGILGSTEPKTMVERNLQFYEGKAMRTPNDPAVWRGYVLSLIAAKQHSKAQDVIDKATKAIDQKASQDILTAQAELYYAQKDYKKAITTADQVQKKLDVYYEAAKKKTGSPEFTGKEISENYWQALLVKAESQAELGQTDAALKSFDAYLKQYKTAADVFVRRGNLRADAGDKEGAEKDFKQALVYLPEDRGALEGLEKIGAKQ